MSRTKWALYGPVAITPGTTPYHQRPANSMTIPFRPRMTASTAEMARPKARLPLFGSQDEAALSFVTRPSGQIAHPGRKLADRRQFGEARVVARRLGHLVRPGQRIGDV